MVSSAAGLVSIAASGAPVLIAIDCGFSASGTLAVGEPVEEICRLAKSLRTDLIVVGHNQNTSFAARWWKGSVGASLLDYAPCSILIALSPS